MNRSEIHPCKFDQVLKKFFFFFFVVALLLIHSNYLNRKNE